VAAGWDKWQRCAASEIDPKRTASKKTRMCFMLGSLFTFAGPIAFPY